MTHSIGRLWKAVLALLACGCMLGNDLVWAADGRTKFEKRDRRPAAQSLPAVTGDELKEFLKESGLTKPQLTLAQFVKNISPFLPKGAEKQFDYVLKLAPDYPMPKIKVVQVPLANGQKMARLILQNGNLGFNLDFPADEEVFAKLNSTPITYLDFDRPDVIEKKVAQVHTETFWAGRNPKSPERSPWITGNDFLNAPQLFQIRFLVKLRAELKQMEKLQERLAAKYAFSPSQPRLWEIFLGESAYADDVRGLVGSGCINAGWISRYEEARASKKIVCSAQYVRELNRQEVAAAGNNDQGLQCGGSQIACNPAVYGYQRGNSGTKAICVAANNLASQSCDDASPIGGANEAERFANQKALVESVTKETLSDLGNSRLAPGTLRRERVQKFFNDLRRQMEDVKTLCENLKAPVLADQRGSDKAACEVTSRRMLNLMEGTCKEMGAAGLTLDGCKDTFILAEDLPPPPNATCEGPRERDPKSDKPNLCACPVGSTEKGKDCVCDDPKMEIREKACVEKKEPAPPAIPKKEGGGWNWKLIAGIGAVAVVGGLIAWLALKKRNRNQTIPTLNLTPLPDVPPPVVNPPVVTPGTPGTGNPPTNPTSEGGFGNNPVTGGGVPAFKANKIRSSKEPTRSGSSKKATGVSN